MKELLTVFCCVAFSVGIILGLSELRAIHEDFAERSESARSASIPLTAEQMRNPDVNSNLTHGQTFARIR